jgi:hypothetical protein
MGRTTEVAIVVLALSPRLRRMFLVACIGLVLFGAVTVTVGGLTLIMLGFVGLVIWTFAIILSWIGRVVLEDTGFIEPRRRVAATRPLAEPPRLIGQQHVDIEVASVSNYWARNQL